MKMLILGAMAFGLCAAPARADVTYTLSQETYSNDSGNPNTRPLAITFTVSNAAVASGSFDLSGSSPSGLTGDIAGFRYFNANGVDTVTPSYLYGSINLAFTFNSATDAITSSSVHFIGTGAEVNINGTGTAVSGVYGDDPSGCSITGPFACHVSAQWTTALPEPASFGLLVAGLFGIATRRRYG